MRALGLALLLLLGACTHVHGNCTREVLYTEKTICEGERSHTNVIHPGRS